MLHNGLEYYLQINTRITYRLLFHHMVFRDPTLVPWTGPYASTSNVGHPAKVVET